MKPLNVIILFLTLLCGVGVRGENPKREFRGAWINTVYQTQYKRNTTSQNKAYLIRQLDSLEAMGINAVFFQVRAQADAFYDSKYEPWSRYLTDGGKAPSPYWDPLTFMIEESHRRGMELHAWLNPYRVTTSANQQVPAGHIARRHPERILRYDGKLYFDPGLPENREYIGKIVDDILARYDVDGIHFDDYFYPYPVRGKVIADDKTYRKYGGKMERDDWRRLNVDLLIEDIHRRITAAKPWVRFGVSPFGIWRNKKSDPRGSDTNGLENYDGLYADVLKWEDKGWVDYIIPQLYWEMDHKAASYRVLIKWWNENAGRKRHVYVGQDVSRTMSERKLSDKIEMSRKADHILGNCWWPAYALTRNEKCVADSLSRVFQSCRSLVPNSPWIYDGKPKPVERIRVSNKVISWDRQERKGFPSDVARYAIYRFDNIGDIDIDKAEAIVDITGDNKIAVSESGCYVVTAIDRVNNESEASNPIIIQQ